MPPLINNAIDDTSPDPDRTRGEVNQSIKSDKSRAWLSANDPDIDAKRALNRDNPVSISDFLFRRQAAVLEILADFTDQDSLSAALLAMADSLQVRFQCDRVVIGLLNGGEMEIASISQQATVDKRTEEARLLTSALQEACAHESLIQYPDDADTLIDIDAHKALVIEQKNGYVCSIPLYVKETVIGAVLLQRKSENSWARLTIELLTQICALVAPLISLKQTTERSITSIFYSRTIKRIITIGEPKHLLAKASAVSAFILIIVAYLLPVTHFIKATAEIVSVERRVISAPTNGFISSIHVSAGDTVQAGDLLLSLDTRELELKKISQENEILGTRAELRAAMASYDRNEIAIVQARLDRLKAELALTGEQLSRTRMTAPVDGIIVSGDISHSLGMSVERGNILLEMAPQDGYEVHLLVHEVDVSYVQRGQSGQLSLTANPGQDIDIEVHDIHPISKAGGGTNRFLVETSLKEDTPQLRPGQTGFAKIAVGEARLLWVWTHRFVEWGRQRIWEWVG